MIRGYSRCSTNESRQDLNRQVRELKAAGAEVVYMEYEHGDAQTKKQLSMLPLPEIPLSCWKYRDWHEAHSSFVRLSILYVKSICGL